MIPLRDNVLSQRWPFITMLFIFINAAVFAKEVSLPPQALERFMLDWALVPHNLMSDPWNQWPKLFTSMFMHGGWSHIIGNMLFLWIFGDNVEDNLSHVRFFFYYLILGAAAGLAQVYMHPASQVPMVGASGAIAGILGSYFILHPGAKVLTLIPLGLFTRVVEIPAFFFLGLWFVLQALQGWGSLMAGGGDTGGGVAWWAHAGGFVAGLILIWVFRRR